MTFKPAEIATHYPDIALKKAHTAPVPLFFRAVLAGVFIAVACFAAQCVAALIPDKGAASLIAPLLFPGGLAMVLTIGAELFTGNCLMPLAVLKKRLSVRELLVCWSLVYIGNLVGAVFTAGIVVASRGADARFLELARYYAVNKASITMGDAFLRAILCNIVVCAAIWMSYATDSAVGKTVLIYFPVMYFVLCGTEHCVANMYYLFAGLFAGVIPEAGGLWPLFRNMIPVTVGNILGGGVLLSGALWFGFYRGTGEAPAR